MKNLFTKILAITMVVLSVFANTAYASVKPIHTDVIINEGGGHGRVSAVYYKPKTPLFSSNQITINEYYFDMEQALDYADFITSPYGDPWSGIATALSFVAYAGTGPALSIVYYLYGGNASHYANAIKSNRKTCLARGYKYLYVEEMDVYSYIDNTHTLSYSFEYRNTDDIKDTLSGYTVDKMEVSPT